MIRLHLGRALAEFILARDAGNEAWVPLVSYCKMARYGSQRGRREGKNAAEDQTDTEKA
jgi:hypothetical protein